jgi:hypothetical protein
MIHKSEYLSIMAFINARKLQDADGAFDEIRQKKYQKNFLTITILYGLGYIVMAGFFAFPLIEFAYKNSYNFPQRIYVPIDFASHSWAVYGAFYIFICFAIHNSGVLAITTCLHYMQIAECLTTEFKVLGSLFEKALNFEGNGILREVTSISSSVIKNCCECRRH